MVQDGIDVVEDVPLGDVRVGVVVAELVQRPVGDVLAAMGAVFVVSVKRYQALGIGVEIKVWKDFNRRYREVRPAVATDADRLILVVFRSRRKNVRKGIDLF